MKIRTRLTAIIGTTVIAAAGAIPAVATAGVPPASGERPGVHAGADRSSEGQVAGRWTKGTKVTFRNDTGVTIWVRQYDCMRDWYSPKKMEPGTTLTFAGDHPGTDDVELRVFKSEDAATSNWWYKSYEIDAENPAYSSPWMSVGYRSQYFREGDTHEWRAELAPDRAVFWGKRHGDTDKFKVFELHMKSVW